MKISFNLGWWFEIERNGKDAVISTSDGNGNEIEINIEEGWLNRKRVKELIKDLNKFVEQKDGE